MSLIKKYLNPQNDMAFKRIFGAEKNKDILLSMLNAVLSKQFHKPIRSVEFLKTVLPPEIEGKKESIVDVLCRDQDGCQYIIEMQIASVKGFEVRAQYYAAKAFVDQAKKGSFYKGLKEVIFLAFCNFEVFPDEKGYKSEHFILNHKTFKRKLDKFSFTFVDLKKFDKSCEKAINLLTLEEKFYYFLYHADEMDTETLNTLAGPDIVIKKAFDELASFNWSEEELQMYDRVARNERDRCAMLDASKDEGIAQGRKEGIAQGRKEGRKEGILEEKIRTLKQLLSSGMSKEQIATTLNMTNKDIEKLLSNNPKS